MIVIAGMIGVGKTSYTKKISEELVSKPFFEPVENNPILDKYYENPERYGFSLQIYFLNKRFELIKEANKYKNSVLDRSIYEDELFTKLNRDNGNISEEEYQIYLELLDNMMEELDSIPKKAPDLLIYLNGSFDTVLRNIKKRGRPYEQPTEENGLLDYYKQLFNEYEFWYDNYDKSQKIEIDVDKYDIIDNDDDWNEVFSKIKSKLEKVEKSFN